MKNPILIDPLLSLAFSMYSNKGVYALLIGSGASSAAGILTGWNIVLDLIRKIAMLEKENCDPDPEAWFKIKFHKDPNYSELLEELAKSPAERSHLLQQYFEPTDEEKELKRKIPTVAHECIAELVADGYIRVIITTNFDRLIEKALWKFNINPIVISTPEAVEGTPPIVHNTCTIVKVNGDYLDTRIKNTPKELEEYDQNLNDLLDRIFDEFGLIVCGWSGEWDNALVKAIERSKNHRYTTYWTSIGEISNKTKRLIDFRQAEIIKIKDANSFFLELKEKVFALRDMNQTYPLSTKVAVATLKRYLSEERYIIRLFDFVSQEIEMVINKMRDNNLFSMNSPYSEEELISRIHRYETIVKNLQSLFVTGCYWGSEIHEKYWVKTLETILNLSEMREGINIWINLMYYPSILLLYSGGIASLAAKKYQTFSALINNVRFFRNGKTEEGFVPSFPYFFSNLQDIFKKMTNLNKKYTPFCYYLDSYLREFFMDYIPIDKEYHELFDRFEYFTSLIIADFNEKNMQNAWGPVGNFGWRSIHFIESSIFTTIENEIKKEGTNWPLLKLGFFNGSLARLLEIKNGFDEMVKKLNWL